MTSTPSSPAGPDMGEPTPFSLRHLGPDDAAVQTMLEAVGQRSLETLMAAAVPASIRDDEPLGLDRAPTEEGALAALRTMAERNQVLTSLIGAGYYGTPPPR